MWQGGGKSTPLHHLPSPCKMQSVLGQGGQGKEVLGERKALQVQEVAAEGGLVGHTEDGVSVHHGKLRSGGNNLDC